MNENMININIVIEGTQIYVKFVSHPTGPNSFVGSTPPKSF